jgi:hypothetical protein
MIIILAKIHVIVNTIFLLICLLLKIQIKKTKILEIKVLRQQLNQLMQINEIN